MIANKMNICSRDIQQFCNTIFDKKNMDDFAERMVKNIYSSMRIYKGDAAVHKNKSILT